MVTSRVMLLMSNDVMSYRLLKPTLNKTNHVGAGRHFQNSKVEKHFRSTYVCDEIFAILFTNTLVPGVRFFCCCCFAFRCITNQRVFVGTCHP